MDTKYERIKVIGKGAFGKAYLVKNTTADRLCVVKQMETGTMEPKDKELAVKEAILLKKMDHPNIVHFEEVFMTRKGRLCIAMEYADGGDVHTAITKQKGDLLAEGVILEWFVQICFALLYVHRKKVLHRDLKSQNVFLMASGQVKLGDFGIAKILEATKDYAKTMVGTPYYLSPEIIADRPYAFKSDVWSLGVLLYEMATLTHPFDADSLVHLAGKILQDNAPEIDASYSAALRRLVKHMLTKDERKRPTVREVLSEKFLNHVMFETNAKYSLGLDLSEFQAEADESEQEDQSAEEAAHQGGGSEHGDNYDDSSGSEQEDMQQPQLDLARSVSNLKLPSSIHSKERHREPPGNCQGGSAIAAKVEALRGYLHEQVSDAEFHKVHALVKASADVGVEDLQTQVGDALGVDKATILLSMFQLLCFLEMAASGEKEACSPTSRDDIEKIVATFKKWDSDCDGTIGKDEFLQVFLRLGTAEEDVHFLFSCADVDRNGKLDYTEFMQWLFTDVAPRPIRQEAGTAWATIQGT